MTGFEPQTSGIESNRSTSWATTTALWLFPFTYLVTPHIFVVIFLSIPAFTEKTDGFSGQSYKQFTLVVYESRVVIRGIFKSGTTLES